MKKIIYIAVFLSLICGCNKSNDITPDVNSKIKECFSAVNEKNLKEAERICEEVIPHDKIGVAEFLLAYLWSQQDQVDEKLKQRVIEITEKNTLAKLSKANSFISSEDKEMQQEGIRIGKEVFNSKELVQLKEQLKYMDIEFAEAINKIIEDQKITFSMLLLTQKDQKEVDEGVRYLEELDQEKVPFATYLLGLLYYGGVLVDQDYNKSFNYFDKLAKTGNSNAQVMLGVMYFMGYAVKEDNLKAYEYWTEAYKQNDVFAKLILEYDDLKQYAKKMSGIKMLASKDGKYQNSIDYIHWITSEDGQKFLYKNTMTPKEMDENMLQFVELSAMGIDFAVGFTSAYLISIGAIKESVEIYDKLHMGKRKGL